LGDPLGNEIGGVLLIEQIKREGPFARVLIGLRSDKRPEFDERRQLIFQRFVRPPYVPLRDNSVLVFAMLEHLVDHG